MSSKREWKLSKDKFQISERHKHRPRGPKKRPKWLKARNPFPVGTLHFKKVLSKLKV